MRPMRLKTTRLYSSRLIFLSTELLSILMISRGTRVKIRKSRSFKRRRPKTSWRKKRFKMRKHKKRLIAKTNHTSNLKQRWILQRSNK
jgi:hypothetical protein